jgi:hypothetical protein
MTEPVVRTRRERERAREIWTGVNPENCTPDEIERAYRAGYEPHRDGDRLVFVGRDPRRMDQDQIRALGHEAMSPMDAIRAKCLDCCADSAHEVRLCVAIACPSWPFRTGKNPWRAPISEERREVLRERGARLSELRKINARSEGTRPAGIAIAENGLGAASKVNAIEKSMHGSIADVDAGPGPVRMVRRST